MKKQLSVWLAALMLALTVLSPLSAAAVAPTDLAAATVKLAKSTYTYSGTAYTPAVTVTVPDGGTGTVTLVEDTDYTVDYTDNINAGTATVTLSGINSYTGTAQKNFTIKPQKLSGKKITFTRTKKGTPGKAPVYTVIYNGTALTEGTDYTVAAANTAKAGVKAATLTYTGTGNFTGTKSFDVSVFPDKVTGFSTKERKNEYLTISWDSQKKKGVDGYKIYFCDEKGNNLKGIKTVTGTSAKVTGLKPGTYYYFVVRAFVEKDNERLYGEDSRVFKSCTKPDRVSLRTVAKSANGKYLSVKWKKTACTAYEIQYTTDKKFKKNIKTVVVQGAKNTSKKIKISKNKKIYYARVRAYRRYNNNKVTVRGNWSARLSTNFGKLYASYDAHYANNPPRTNNLRIACKAINGTVVYPGETFSFNRTVGQRTASKGYKPAPIFNGPNEVLQGVGGGVCQVASTMFNTALYANVQIVERHQHSQRVHYGTLGRDAAIYWTSEDFKWRNNTDYPIKIKMWCENGRIHCDFYVSYDVKPKKVKLKVTQNGKHFRLTRTAGGEVNYSCNSYY